MMTRMAVSNRSRREYSLPLTEPTGLQAADEIVMTRSTRWACSWPDPLATGPDLSTQIVAIWTTKQSPCYSMTRISRLTDPYNECSNALLFWVKLSDADCTALKIATGNLIMRHCIRTHVTLQIHILLIYKHNDKEWTEWIVLFLKE